MTYEARSELADRFRKFAALETHGITPLYEQFCVAAAGQPELLEIASHARPGQPPPNMLFGAVHFLLLAGASHELAAFYPTIVESPSAGDAVPAFIDFCLVHERELSEIISSRITQTNEVGRSALLLPAFQLVFEEGGEKPLYLVEIGPSAGLNLNFDRYQYAFGERRRVGDPDSPLRLATTPKGGRLPPESDSFPEVAFRIGVDQNPLEIGNPKDELWLRALVWPEDLDRMRCLEKAIAIAREHPPNVVPGDGLERLDALLDSTPPGAMPVVFHTFVLYQQTPSWRAEFDKKIAAWGNSRDLHRVGIEWTGQQAPLLELDSFKDGTHTNRALARCSPHGRWIEWLA